MIYDFEKLRDFGIEIPESKLDRATVLQNGLMAESTGGSFDGGDALYKALRKELIEGSNTKSVLPEFLRTTRDLTQFWQFIKHKFDTYAERRNYLYEQFSPLLDFLESSNNSAHERNVGEAFEKFVPGHVPDIWNKAIERTKDDPEGAITLARTLLESVCKYILDEEKIEYKSDGNLPTLWRACSKQLNLSPSQHTETVFKAILGSCENIVSSLGSLRNKISDSHGQGKRPVKPLARHAELSVNLAGSMAQFLVSTWESKRK